MPAHARSITLSSVVRPRSPQLGPAPLHWCGRRLLGPSRWGWAWRSEYVFKMFVVHVWSKLNSRGSTAICPVSCRAYTRSVISSWKDHGPYCSNIESNKNRKKYAKDLLVRIRCAKHMNLLAAPFEQISAKTVLLGESAPTWCDNELCTLHDQVVRSIKPYRYALDRGIEANDSLFHGD